MENEELERQIAEIADGHSWTINREAWGHNGNSGEVEHLWRIGVFRYTEIWISVYGKKSAEEALEELMELATQPHESESEEEKQPVPAGGDNDLPF